MIDPNAYVEQAKMLAEDMRALKTENVALAGKVAELQNACDMKSRIIRTLEEDAARPRRSLSVAPEELEALREDRKMLHDLRNDFQIMCKRNIEYVAEVANLKKENERLQVEASVLRLDNTNLMKQNERLVAENARLIAERDRIQGFTKQMRSDLMDVIDAALHSKVYGHQ